MHLKLSAKMVAIMSWERWINWLVAPVIFVVTGYFMMIRSKGESYNKYMMPVDWYFFIQLDSFKRKGYDYLWMLQICIDSLHMIA